MTKYSKAVIRSVRLAVVVFIAAGVISCPGGSHPEGLAKAGGGDGPKIVFRPLAKPIPEVPFPNDIATVLDKSTGTGRRINISPEAPTQAERDVRKHINKLDGFGTYSPISIRFEKPLDLSTIKEKNIMVIKLLGPKLGQVVPLDLGKGFFPFIWEPDTPWWRHDPYGDANNIAMDPGNVADLDGDTVVEFVDFYEFETDTLIIRTLYPLEEASRYAVVILDGLTGANSHSVRSPFEYINHTMQTDDLKPLKTILPNKGISLDDVAFCWSFTTQTVTKDWVNIWKGLAKGEGPLGYLKQKFPPVLNPHDLESSVDGDGNYYTLQGDWLGEMLKYVFLLSGDLTMSAVMDFRYIDYFVFGKFKSPSFFDSLDFGDPLSAKPHWFSPAKLSGKEKVDTIQATWIIAIPRDEDMGLDGCQSVNHPHGCKDYEEAGAKGVDDGFGFKGVDDNGDTFIDDSGEYMWPGSDDAADPAGDNYDPLTGLGTQGNGVLDYDFGPDNMPGDVLVDDDNNGVTDDITEFGWPSTDDGLTEDANGDGRLNTPPFPVSLYGHGSGLGGFESIGFAGPMAQFGIALAGMDNFGHGPLPQFVHLPDMVKDLLVGLGADLAEVCDGSPSTYCDIIYNPSASADSLLEIVGADLNGDRLVNLDDIDGKTIETIIEEVFNIRLFQILSTEGRSYDINGDTTPDSGDIFWTANVFQTRDIVRQTAIDYMQFARILDAFGTRSHNDLDGDTTPDMEGDFNLDGRYDIGGPVDINTRGHYFTGSSLGGILGDVSLGANPRVVVGAPVAGAGGFPDVIPRSHQRSATRPVLLQICGPIIVGDYDDGVHTPEAGKASLSWNDDRAGDNFGFLDVEPDSKIKVTNLKNGEVNFGMTDAEGNFSVGIPADVGDKIKIECPAADSQMITVAVYHGLGLNRNTPDLRRFMMIGQWAMEKGDAINLAKHYFSNQLGSPLPDSPEKAILQINTVGDPNVPINTGNSIGTAAGLWTLDQAQALIDNGLNMGYAPSWSADYAQPIYDPEDVDDDGLHCGFAPTDPRCDPTAPALAPLPPVHAANGNKVSAMRFHYVNERGHHAFALPRMRNHGIDWGMYMMNQIGYYFTSDGSCVVDDPWELHSMEYIDPGPDRILQTVPASDDIKRSVRKMTTLGALPCDYPFPEYEIISTGPNFTIETAPASDDVLVEFDDLYRGP